MPKMQAGDSNGGATLSEGVFGAALSEPRDDASASGASIQRGGFIYSPYGVFKYDEKNKKMSHQINPCSSDSKKSSSNKGSSLWSPISEKQKHF